MWAFTYALGYEQEGVPLGTNIAIGNMDRTWTFDWEKIERLARMETEGDPGKTAIRMYAELFLAARGRLPEVSLERSDEIARAYGSRYHSG